MEAVVREYKISTSELGNRTLLARLGWLAFATWIVMTVDGLSPQVQAALGGGVVIPNVAWKFIFLALLLAAGLCGRRVRVPSRLRVAYFLFVLYLGIDAFVLFFFWPPYSLEYVLFGYNAYFFFLVALGLFAYTGQTLRESTLALWTLLIFLPLGALGVAQHLTGLPLVPLAAGDGPYGYATTSYDFFGQMRAFSLFSDAWEFGAFASLVASIALSRALFSRGRGRFFWAVAFAAASVAVYCTLTRMIYLEFLLGSASVVLMWRASYGGRWRGRLKWLPLAYALCAALIVFYVGVMVGSNSAALNNVDTLVGRQSLWLGYLHAWTGGGVVRFLFGTGVIQNNRFVFSQDVLIDNTYLGIATEVGLIGLVLWLYLTWRIWRYLLDETLRLPSAMRVGLASFFSTWLATGTFAIVIGQFAVVVWLYIATIPHVRLARRGLEVKSTVAA